MSEMLEFIKGRRSTRSFKDQPIPQEYLEEILEAGRHAPSGGNSQTTHFIVIRNKEVMDKLADIATAEFAKMEVTENTYRSLAGAIRASKKGKFNFHYFCPVLIVTANKIGYGNSMADCSCALENMMLMANALNLGSVWINQLHWLTDTDALKEYMHTLGLGEDEWICGALAVGYPNTPDGLPNREALPRTGNPVTFVD